MDHGRRTLTPPPRPHHPRRRPRPHLRRRSQRRHRQLPPPPPPPRRLPRRHLRHRPSRRPPPNTPPRTRLALHQQVTAHKASTKAPRRTGGRRVGKTTYVEDQIVTLTDGTEITIHLFARGGAIGIGTQNPNGEITFTELERIRTHRNPDKGGYRWYKTYQLPHNLGGGTITVRLHNNADDERRRFNRTENVRQIPPTDADFAALYKRRNDAESINRALDDTLWLRRAHSIGRHRQHLNMLTHALVVNSVSIRRHRQLQGTSPPTHLAA